MELPAGLWQPIGEQGIPYDTPEDVTATEFDFRTARRIGLTQLDSALTGLTREADGRVRARLSGARAQVTLWAGPGYEWLQVFTGDTLDPSHRRKAVAIEPMTCPPNAFVSGVDLLMLEPGDSVTHTWGIEVAPVTPPPRHGQCRHLTLDVRPQRVFCPFWANAERDMWAGGVSVTRGPGQVAPALLAGTAGEAGQVVRGVVIGAAGVRALDQRDQILVRAGMAGPPRHPPPGR